MEKIFRTLIVIILIGLGSSYSAGAAEPGKLRFDEVKIKAMLEQFVGEHASDEVINRYRFDMSRDFLDFKMTEHGNGVWSIRQWTVEAKETSVHEINQSVDYGPGLALIKITFSADDAGYRIVDWTVIEIELVQPIE